MVLMGYVDMANKSLYVALTFVAVERTPITGLLAVAQLFGYINGLVRLYLMSRNNAHRPTPGIFGAHF